MKKKLLGVITAVIMTIFPVLVSAEETEAIAKIGDKTYATLQEAVDAVEVNGASPTTIEILRDAENIPGIKIVASTPKNIIIDFGGHKISLGLPLVGSTGTVSQNLHFEKNSTVVLKNGTVKAAEEAAMLIQNYADLTIQNMTIDATTSSKETVYALSLNNGVVSIEGETNIYSDGYAIDVYWWPNNSYVDGTQVTINTTGVVEGTIIVSPDPNATLTDIKTTLTVENIEHDGEFIIDESMINNVVIKDGSYTDDSVAENITIPEGSDVYEVGCADGTTKFVVATDKEIEEGYFGLEISEDYVDEYLEFLGEEDSKLIKEALGDKYTATTYYEIYYGNIIGESFVLGSEITELEDTVEITLDIPATLAKVKEGYTRNYVVIRLHEGKVDELKAIDNGDGTISFETDKFSTYVLAYEDVELQTVTNPTTYDGIHFYIMLGAFSVIAIIAISVYATKKKAFN